MQLTIHLKNLPTADGNYHVKAPGAIAATLYWANAAGALADWQSFACIPISTSGTGCFRFTGGRAIPEDATHVLARAVSADFSTVQEVLAPIPGKTDAPEDTPAQRFLVLSDLHLSAKPWQVRRALAMGRGYDAVLITGDLTNDGTQAQLELFWQCVNDVLPQTPVLAVAGNHDYPAHPLPRIADGICDYYTLQQLLLNRATAMGLSCHTDDSGAYAVTLGDTRILGLNAATHWRRFRFPDNAQLQWLLFHLLDSGAKRNMILCHAPLAAHRPYRSAEDPPYLSRDAVLQRIVDVERSQVIFLSGHTHISLNALDPVADMAPRNHLYLNAGSIRPTTLKADEPLQPEDWTQGNVVDLRVSDRGTVVTGISVKTGKKIPRGHFVFPNP